MEEKSSQDKVEELSETWTAKMFEGQELTEDFRTRTATVFRAALQEAVDSEQARLQEAFTEQLSDIKEEYELKLVEEKDKLSEHLDTYLEHVVEDYLTKNEVAIASNMKVEAAEAVLESMRTTFADNYLEVPEGRNIAEEYDTKIAELTAKLDESIDNTVTLKTELRKRDASTVLESVGCWSC